MKKWIGVTFALTIIATLMVASVISSGASGEPDVAIPSVINYQGYITTPDGDLNLNANSTGELNLSGHSVSINSATDLNIVAGLNTDFQAGAQIDIHSGGMLDLRGANIKLNAVTSGSPAARQGDLVSVGKITTGSSSVLIGP